MQVNEEQAKNLIHMILVEAQTYNIERPLDQERTVDNLYDIFKDIFTSDNTNV